MGKPALSTLEKNILIFLKRERGRCEIKHIVAYADLQRSIVIGVLEMMNKKKLLSIDHDAMVVSMDIDIYVKLICK